MHQLWKFGEYPSNNFQHIMLTMPDSAVTTYSIPSWPKYLTFWVLTPNWYQPSSLSHKLISAFITVPQTDISLHHCPTMHHWRKFGENLSRTFQVIMLLLTMFSHTRTRTDTRKNSTKPLSPWPQYIGRRHDMQCDMESLRIDCVRRSVS